MRTRVCILLGESSIIQWTSLYSVGCDIFKLRRPTLRVRDVKYDSSKRRGRFRALWKFYYKLFIYIQKAHDHYPEKSPTIFSRKFGFPEIFEILIMRRLTSLWVLLLVVLISIQSKASLGSQPSAEAYVTLLYGDEFLLGVRVLGKSIRDTKSKKDLVVLVSDGVSDYAKKLLQVRISSTSAWLLKIWSYQYAA